MDNDNNTKLNTKTSVFRNIGRRRLERLRNLVGQDDTLLLEMFSGLMTETEFLEISSVLSHYIEIANKNRKEQGQ